MTLPEILTQIVPLGTRVLECSIVAGVLGTFFLAFHWKLGRKLHPGWLYGLGLVVLLRFLLIDVPGSPWSWKNWRLLAAPEVAEASPMTPAANPRNEEMGLAEWRQLAAQFGQIAPAAQPLPVAEARERAAFSTAGILSGIWAVGCVTIGFLALCRQMRFQMRLRRLAQPLPESKASTLRGVLASCQNLTGVRGRLSVRLLPGLGSPCVFGWWRPQLLLPAEMLELDPEEWRHIFCHELAHIKGRDALVNWLPVAAQALHWFNPVVWLAGRQLLRDRELLRDAQAIKWLSGGASCREYGLTLLKLATQSSALPVSPGLASLFPTEKEIHRRITMITHPITHNRSGLRLCLTMAALTAVAMVAFTDAMALGEPPADPARSVPAEAKALPTPLVEKESLPEPATASVPAVPGSAMSLEEKLKTIVLPRVAFESASLDEGIGFVKKKSMELDPTGTNRGVNFVVNLDAAAKPKTLTLDLTNVPLGTLIEQICLLAGCSFRVTEHAVIIESAPDNVAKDSPNRRLEVLAKNLEDLKREIKEMEGNPKSATEVIAMKSVQEKLTKEYYALRYGAAAESDVSEGEEIDAVISAVVTAAKSPLLDELYLQFTKAEAELAALEFDGHGGKHPKVLSQRAKVASLRKVLGERAKALVAAPQGAEASPASAQPAATSPERIKLEAKKIELETQLQYDIARPGESEEEKSVRKSKMVAELIAVKQELMRLDNAPPAAPEKPAATPSGARNGASERLMSSPPTESLPYGGPVIGKPGFVYSPYAQDKGMIDVTNIPKDTKVECPYTGKKFRVP